MVLKRRLFFLNLFWLLMGMGIFIHSQQVRHLSVSDGLNGRQAFNFCQDKDGFVWISNRFGVDRYDGHKIKNYSLPLLNEAKSPLREVHVVLDSDSVLWAFTDNGGIYFYNEKKDNFDLHKNLPYYLKSIFFDTNNDIWFGTNNSFGLVKENGVVVYTSDILNNKLVRRIFKYDDKNLLIITTKSVNLYNTKTKKISRIFTKSIHPNLPYQIESAYYDAAGEKLWIGSVSGELICLNFTDNSTKTINSFRSLHYPVLSISSFDKNHLYLGTDGIGALLFNKNTFDITPIFNQPQSNIQTLSGNGINDIFKDREERIWMSTYTDGINIIEPENTRFYTLNHDKNNSQTIASNIITNILEDRSGKVWFGTSNGISIWSRPANQWRHLLPAHNVLTLLEDSKKNIWVGTYSSGVYLMDANGNILKHYLKGAEQNSIGTNFVYSIFEDSQNNIWIGGIKGNLSKLDTKNNTFKQINLSQINYITQIQDELLVSTVTGLFFISLKTNQEKAWKHNSALRSKYLYDILIENDSTVWLTSYGGGFSRCNLRTGKIENFTTENGLESDIVYSILKDGNESLWLSTEAGISKMNLNDKTITNFTTGDGISDKSFRPLSRLKTRSGQFFFGSYNGLTYFYPEEITNTTSNSKIVFLGFSLFNRVTHPEDKDSPLKDKINNTANIDLSHSQHSFSLNFTTLNFAPKSKQSYMWKLEGLDNEWIGPTSETVVNYTNLEPKKYTFKLKAIGNGNIVLDEREIDIVIHPPFWDTILAKIIGFILFLLLVYWGYRYMSNYYEKKRTNEKIKFFINTTHDLRTPLTLISSPLYELKEKITLDEWSKYLFDLVAGNLDKMNKMVSQLLDFQKAYEYKEQLIISKNNVNKLLTDKITSWRPVAERKNINLSLFLPDNTLFEWFDRVKFDKIFDNLISNALKYTLEGGKITVTLSFATKYWEVSVQDTGIGIPKEAARNLFQRFYRAENAINSQETGSGLGLLLIKNYISLHKGKVWVKSTQNNGSTFYVRLNRGYKHYKKTLMLEENENPNEIPLSQDTEINQEDYIAKIKILIVEDNADLREYLKLSLSNFFITYTAENGQDAWEQIPSVNPDIVITDFNMPKMNGFELCENIKNTYETSHIPVILLTVMNDEKHVEQGLKSGADDYIEKPFDLKYLKLKIDNIINNRKILRTKFLDVNNPLKATDPQEIFNNDFLSKATEIVNEHMTDTAFSITELSREMGMSRSLLYTKFNAVTGYNPNDFIKIIRMKKAIELFKEKKYTINEVAGLTGFDEPSYFTTCFKKIYGKSPKQFIKEDL